MKYRIYIDENGNPDLAHSDDPRYRFLALTGVIFEIDYIEKVVAPEVEELKKRFFHSHPDDPVILHRKELVNRKPPFERLEDSTIREQFNHALLELLGSLSYVVVTIVIDKKVHRDLYKVWHADPYHYCLAILMERYFHFLSGEGSKGDAMAESRGGNEDMRMKRSFENLYREGTSFVSPDQFNMHLTSSELKVKPKANNIAGLQICDIVAHPSQRYVLKLNNKIADRRDVFGDRIAELLVNSKYYRSASGRIDGYGVKMLP